jgi:hypothetical protein
MAKTAERWLGEGGGWLCVLGGVTRERGSERVVLRFQVQALDWNPWILRLIAASPKYLQTHTRKTGLGTQGTLVR